MIRPTFFKSAEVKKDKERLGIGGDKKIIYLFLIKKLFLS